MGYKDTIGDSRDSREAHKLPNFSRPISVILEDEEIYVYDCSEPQFRDSVCNRFVQAGIMIMIQVQKLKSETFDNLIYQKKIITSLLP